MTDRSDITALVHAYARLIDAGDLDGVAALFEHATWRSAGHGTVLRGTAELRTAYDGIRLYDRLFVADLEGDQRRTLG
jgi:ketosteroid isomerase-like protein